MELPEDITLPLFTYGIFKPGQLGYFRLKDFVTKKKNAKVPSELKVRDGLPIFDGRGHSEVEGVLLFFNKEHCKEAYEHIIEIEPDKQYEWGTCDAKVDNESYEANILLGKKPDKGTVRFKDEYEDYLHQWDSKEDDPLFTTALDVVQDVISECTDFEFKGGPKADLKPFFRLQMAYLLLWTSIERYASLRYGLKEDPHRKVKQISSEEPFAKSLQEHVREKRSVQRADDPTEKETLDPEKTDKAIDYYYQVRSNITHRGKSAPHDFELLKSSLFELKAIFDDVLRNAFETSQQ